MSRLHTYGSIRPLPREKCLSDVLKTTVGTVPLFTNFHRRGIFYVGPTIQYRKLVSTVS
jgi:hypothetical protein